MSKRNKVGLVLLATSAFLLVACANKRGQVSFRSILPLTIIPTPRQSPTRGHNVLQFPGNHMLQFGMPK